MKKRYKVITGTAHVAFAAAIEAYLNQGWQLVGGLVLAPNALSNTGAGQSNVTFAQAITCTTAEPPTPVDDEMSRTNDIIESLHDRQVHSAPTMAPG